MLKGQSTKRVLLAALLISATPMLASCASRTSIGATSRVFCEAAQPITWSDADSDQTIREIKAHNASYDAVCSG